MASPPFLRKRLLENNGVDGLHAVERHDHSGARLGAIVLLGTDAVRQPGLGVVLTVGGVAQRLGIVGADLLLQRNGAEEGGRLGGQGRRPC